MWREYPPDWKRQDMLESYKRWRRMHANFFVETDNWFTVFSEEECHDIEKVSKILQTHETVLAKKLERVGFKEGVDFSTDWVSNKLDRE